MTIIDIHEIATPGQIEAIQAEKQAAVKKFEAYALECRAKNMQAIAELDILLAELRKYMEARQ